MGKALQYINLRNLILIDENTLVDRIQTELFLDAVYLGRLFFMLILFQQRKNKFEKKLSCIKLILVALLKVLFPGITIVQGETKISSGMASSINAITPV